jgi:diguanylate cyclase (GGDEF)-like protein/PAS domain S-box-containing protein
MDEPGFRKRNRLDSLESQDIPDMPSGSDRQEVKLSLDTLLRSLPGMVYRCRNDPSWTMEFVSAHAEDVTGYRPEELLGAQRARYAELIHPDDREYVYREVQAAIQAGRTFQLVYRITTAHGEEKWVSEYGNAVYDGSGELPALEGFIIDITHRKQAEEALRESEARFRDQASLLEKAQDAILVRGMDHRVLFWNKSAERLYGWSADEAIGKSIHELIYDDLAAFNEANNAVLESGEWSGEITQRRKNGSAMPVEAHWTVVRDDEGKPKAVLSINTDITQRKAAESKIRHLAFYDVLTRLPNRLFLLERLQHSLANSARNRHTGALMFIDLDNFKTLNDTRGHDKGDLLLKEVAQRLTSCMRGSDTIARLGGDEFVVLLEELDESSHVAAVQAKTAGEKILAAFKQPFDLAGYEHHSSPSIGVTLFKGQEDSVDEIMKRADVAMYQAKGAGRNTMRFFDPEIQAGITRRVVMEADLRRGVRDNEFLLHYQPQADANDRITGVEALVRWRHPQLGLVPPAEFIPLAEETGLILPLGHWVLQTACAQLVAWAASPETAELSMAVNVSARQFRHPNFVAQVLAVLEQTGADPRKLKLELTESLLIIDMEDTIVKMSALKAKGVGFSLDDFGTGYSSLAYLKRLPLDHLKIDQSFVRDVMTDANDATIARTIVALGLSLGLHVIAEGVETMAQHDFLADQGCHAYQGFLFNPPLPIDELDAFVRREAGNRGMAPASTGGSAQ